MKKLTSLAIRTFIVCSTVCVAPLFAASLYEVFREKSIVHPMNYGPAIIISMIACINIVLESYLKKHETKEAIELK